MRQPTESLDVLGAEVRDQLAAQLRHFERLDAKAGVLLGFAGLVVALVPDNPTVWIAAARLTAVMSATAGVLALAADRFPILDAVELSTYVSADADTIRLILLDTHVEVFEEARRLTQRKMRLVKVTTTALLAAIAFAATGFLVTFEPGG